MIELTTFQYFIIVALMAIEIPLYKLAEKQLEDVNREEK